VVKLSEEDPLYIEGGSCNRPDPEALIPVYRLFEAEMKLALRAEISKLHIYLGLQQPLKTGITLYFRIL